MINNREELTQATMNALNGKLEANIDKKENCKKHISKLVECYSKDSKSIILADILVVELLKFMDENDLMDVISICEQQYNNI